MEQFSAVFREKTIRNYSTLKFKLFSNNLHSEEDGSYLLFLCQIFVYIYENASLFYCS